MYLGDAQPISRNFAFFEPSRLESDHEQIETHVTMNLDTGDGPQNIRVPKGANVVMAQAISQNVNYTLDGTVPTATTGFALVAGNNPVYLPVRVQRVILQVHAAVDGARLELQFGRI